MKKGLKGLLVLMIFSIAFLVIAAHVITSISISRQSPANFQNISGNFLLNATLILAGNGTQLGPNATTNVTFMFSNMTNAYMYNTTVFNLTQNQTTNGSPTLKNYTFANDSFDTSLLADGIYNVSINVTNSTGSSHQNISSIASAFGYNITIDNTPPNVNQTLTASLSGFKVVNGSNFSASNGNVSINFTVTDTKPAQVGPGAEGGLYQANLFNISSVRFVFDNGTGTDFNLSSEKGNVSNLSGVWTVNYNLSSLFEGPQGVIVYANDTHNNTRVVIFNFTIDRTAPGLTLATSNVGSDSAKVTATINESVSNCTFTSVAGAQGSAGSGNLSVATAGTLTSYTKTFSSLTAGTGYQIEVTCTDFVGYTVTNGLSWSTSAAAAASSNGGSGSGGAGGGISSGVKGETAKEVWNSINAGETASVKVENGAIGITEVSFSVPATVYGAWVQVSKKDSLPSTVSSFSGKVYKNLEIIKGPALNKEGSFTDAAIEFKVEKAWLAEKQLGKEAVALHRYVNGAWVELSTTVGEDDGTYVHYSAKTPGFSYFVIGEKSGAVAAAPEEAAPAVEAPAEEPAAEAAPAEELAMEQKGLNKGLLVAFLVALAVIVAVVLYLKKRK